MNLQEIQQIFFQECEEGLAVMEASFAAIREEAHDPETINTIFRAVHSIKGGAGAFGHERLQAFTHRYETLLDLVRNGRLRVSPMLLGTVVAAFDKLTDHVAAARDGTEAPSDASIIERLVVSAMAAEGEAGAGDTQDAAPADGDGFDDLFAMLDEGDASPAGPSPWLVTVRPAAGALANGGEPLLLLRELARLGGEVVEAELGRLPALPALDPDQSYCGWTLSVPGEVEESDIRGVFDFLDGEVRIERTAAPDAPADTAPAPPSLADPVETPVAAAILSAIETRVRPSFAPPVQTVRVELDKLDRLVNLVGELVITQSMLAQRLSEHGMGSVAELTDLHQLTRELQDSTMAIRAQPMKTVFNRVPRIIRELEVETGKRVRLEVDGEMTEVDKTVVERIGEPLTHLIRNAVDHGLEDRDERIAAGKPEEGLVRLTAAHQSGRIVITVADDGRGIDRGRVRAKAVERGIIAADATLSDEDTDNLIFAPGFSTAANVSTISGRGVGLDVVRKNVQALGGRIGIQSQLGRGSSFSLSVPLTLAVLDGMIVAVGDQTFVIPLGHVVESIRPVPGAVKAMGGGCALFDVRGTYLPVHRVADQLGVAGSATEPSQAVLVVVECDSGQAVLMVDSIQDQRQVVVKSLEANYEAVHGLAGATILGNGRVALILDVDALISRWRRDARAASEVTGLAA